jgi:hypothetical protein
VDLHSYQPEQSLVLTAPRKNDPFQVGHGLRAMLLWPLMPLWLLWLAILALRRDLRLDKPLWLRSMAWDGGLAELRVRFGLWPMHVTGRKRIRFERMKGIELAAGHGPDGGIELVATVEHTGGSLRCRLDLARAFDLAAAEGLLLRIARVSGWRHFVRHPRDDGGVRLVLSRSPSRDGQAGKALRRPRLGAGRKGSYRVAAPPSAEQQAALRRASSWRVASWRSGEAVVLRKPWDWRAVVTSLLLILPLSPVAAGFLLVGAGVFVLTLPTLLEAHGLVSLPSRPVAAVVLASLGLGALAMLVDVFRGYLREYGPRRLSIDWQSRTIQLTTPFERVALAFEDIEALVVRGPWPGEPPTNVGYDVRPAIEIERRGADTPLRLVWIAYTRGHDRRDRQALTDLAAAAADALGVPHRRRGYQELEMR